MKKTVQKLALNQETLKNLTERNIPRGLATSNFSKPDVCCVCTKEE